MVENYVTDGELDPWPDSFCGAQNSSRSAMHWRTALDLVRLICCFATLRSSAMAKVAGIHDGPPKDGWSGLGHAENGSIELCDLNKSRKARQLLFASSLPKPLASNPVKITCQSLAVMSRV